MKFASFDLLAPLIPSTTPLDIPFISTMLSFLSLSHWAGCSGGMSGIFRSSIIVTGTNQKVRQNNLQYHTHVRHCCMVRHCSSKLGGLNKPTPESKTRIT